jgi:uncharacterized protein YuzE
MIVRYFKDTDTAVLEFADRPVKEPREIAENVLVGVDATGTVATMTIEHASERAAASMSCARDRQGAVYLRVPAAGPAAERHR